MLQGMYFCDLLYVKYLCESLTVESALSHYRATIDINILSLTKDNDKYSTRVDILL